MSLHQNPEKYCATPLNAHGEPLRRATFPPGDVREPYWPYCSVGEPPPYREGDPPFVRWWKAYPVAPRDWSGPLPTGWLREPEPWKANPKRKFPEKRLKEPSFMYYEALTGDSSLNFNNVEDFLRTTRVVSPEALKSFSNPAAPQNPENVAQAPTNPSREQGHDTNPPPEQGHASPLWPRRRGRCTREEAMSRKLDIMVLLRQNTPRPEIYRYAKATWGIGKRQTQLYISHITKLQANEAKSMDYLAHLQRSKEQYEDLHNYLIRQIATVKPEKAVPMVNSMARLLKQINDVAREIKDHRMFCKRDISPDSQAAIEKRDRVITLPYYEFFERLENLRNHWRWEWDQEQMAAMDRATRELQAQYASRDALHRRDAADAESWGPPSTIQPSAADLI